VQVILQIPRHFAGAHRFKWRYCSSCSCKRFVRDNEQIRLHLRNQFSRCDGCLSRRDAKIVSLDATKEGGFRNLPKRQSASAFFSFRAWVLAQNAHEPCPSARPGVASARRLRTRAPSGIRGDALRARGAAPHSNSKITKCASGAHSTLARGIVTRKGRDMAR
jgi:hypothetical protein